MTVFKAKEEREESATNLKNRKTRLNPICRCSKPEIGGLLSVVATKNSIQDVCPSQI